MADQAARAASCEPSSDGSHSQSPREATMIIKTGAIASETDSSARYSVPIPHTKFYACMSVGHSAAKGHELAGRLVSDDGEIWRIERSCCQVQS